MKEKTRGISILLILCLLFSLGGVSAMAEVPEKKPVIEVNSLIPEEQPKVPEGQSIVREEQPAVPEVQPIASEVQAIVPEVQAIVPEVQTVVPEVQTVVPEVQTVVPEVQAIVPEVQTVVPEVQTVVPAVQTIVPEVQSIASEVQTVVPEVQTVVPEVQPAVPEVQSIALEVQPAVPEVQSIALEVQTTIPEMKATVPDEQSVVPEVQTIVPEVQPAVPEVQAIALEVQTTIPEMKPTVPEVQSVVPEVQTMVPEVQSVAEGKQTNVPMAETETPADSVPDESALNAAPQNINQKNVLLKENKPQQKSLVITAENRLVTNTVSPLVGLSPSVPSADDTEMPENEEDVVSDAMPEPEGGDAIENDDPENQETLSGARSAKSLNMNTGLGEEDEPGQEENENSEETESGDTKNEQNGIVLEGEGSFDILITGTLETDGTPVLISESVTPDNVSITVWKIDGSAADEKGEKHVVLEGTPGEPKTVTDDSKAVEESIHYIILIEPSQEDMIALSGTEKVHDYDTATEGTTVTLKIEVPDGYTLTGAFNGKGEKIALEKDSDGNYYVVVPRGGGVYLSAELKKDEDHGKDWEDWVYKWFPGTDVKNENHDSDWRGQTNNEPVETEKKDEEDQFCVIIFDFNGGTLNGSAGPVFARSKIGETVTLLDAPTRPGYRFVRWASSPEVSVSMPRETFTVSEGVKFVAVWDGPVWPAGNDHDDNLYDKLHDDDDDDDDDDDRDMTETLRIDQDIDEELDFRSIRVTGDKATGVEMTASADVDIDHDITVRSGSEGATGIDITAFGREVTVEVETGDGVTVSAVGGDAAGVHTVASAGGQIDLEVEGNTKVSSDSGKSTGITASADSSSGVTIAIEGDLSTKG